MRESVAESNTCTALAPLAQRSAAASPLCNHRVATSLRARADAFFESIKNSVDTLLEEGRAGAPKMMSVGLHQRTIGHTKFAPGLKKLLDYIQSHGDEIWVAKRSDISRHWWETDPGGLRPK